MNCHKDKCTDSNQINKGGCAVFLIQRPFFPLFLIDGNFAKGIGDKERWVAQPRGGGHPTHVQQRLGTALQEHNIAITSSVVGGFTKDSWCGVMTLQTSNERKQILVGDTPWCQAQAAVLRSPGQEKVLMEPPVEHSSLSVCNVAVKRQLQKWNGSSNSDGGVWTGWYYSQSIYCWSQSTTAIPLQQADYYLTSRLLPGAQVRVLRLWQSSSPSPRLDS